MSNICKTSQKKGYIKVILLFYASSDNNAFSLVTFALITTF